MSRRRATPLDLADLATLDPAGPADPAAATSVPAQALLERVLATPREDPPGLPAVPGRRPTPRRVPARRLALASAAVAVLAVAVVVLPGLGDRGADAAWTARPGVLDEPATQAAAEECRETWRAADPEDGPTADELSGMLPLVAEHRGDVDLVVIGQGPWVASCLLSDDGAISGLSGPDSVKASPPQDGVSWWFGGASLKEDGGLLAAVVGRAGPDVAAVTLHPEHGADGVDAVHATLRDGWFIAFWPNELDWGSTDTDRIPLTLTLRTGEVLRDVVVPWQVD